MDIQKYSSFFHDGTIISIFHHKNSIEILMESAEILPEWNMFHISLSRHQTITGILRLEEINIILINGSPVTELKMPYDDGEILHFRFKEKKVDLLIKWRNFLPKIQVDSVDHIIIEANKIEWDNIPSLLDGGNLAEK